MKVAVVIVTYNGEHWLNACLQSVFNSTIPLEVIVVDNYSNDTTTKIINAYQNLILLQQGSNLGFGIANNIGISYALQKGADYVFLLNQDAYLESNTIENLIKVYQSHEDFGILSPLHLNGNGSALDQNFSNYIQKNITLLYDALKHEYTINVYDVPFINAAGWLISKTTLTSIGGFDPIFKHYGEDVNYCQRLIYHGFKIGIVPNAILYHDRENRKHVDRNSQKEQLMIAERTYKVNWANINTNINGLIKQRKRHLKKNLFKSLLKLNPKQVGYYYSELQLIDRIVLEIKKSRDINIKQGAHYLEIDCFKNIKP